MGITRTIVKPVVAFVGSFNSSSTFIQMYSTVHCVNQCSTYYGQIIDRLQVGPDFSVVDLALNLQTTAGSTGSANYQENVTLTTWLQHGASSGMGDAATLTPPVTYADKGYFTTAGSTEYASYTTEAPMCNLYTVNTYDLNGAKRYLRPAFSVSKATATTCTTRTDGSFLVSTLVFHGGNYPQKEWTGATTTTSTGTYAV
jgi:hypothetical protein